MNRVDELAKIIETGLAEGGALYDIDFLALKNAREALAELVSLADPEAETRWHRPTLEAVLKGLRSEDSSTQLRAIIAQVEAMLDEPQKPQSSRNSK